MRRNQRGFTLLELMVVIVIVAILAAVAVPLYTNYVHDAQRAEAKGIASAIITAEQAFFQRNGGTQYGSLQDIKDSKDLDIPEAEANWVLDVTPNGATGFEVKVTGKGGQGQAPQDTGVDYTYDRTNGTVKWTDLP